MHVEQHMQASQLGAVEFGNSLISSPITTPPPPPMPHQSSVPISQRLQLLQQQATSAIPKLDGMATFRTPISQVVPLSSNSGHKELYQYIVSDTLFVALNLFLEQRLSRTSSWTNL